MGNSQDKSKIVIKEKITIEQPKGGDNDTKKSWLKSCFGGKNKKTIHQKTVIRQQRPFERPSSFIRDTRKSSILVKSQPFINLDQKLFENREKKLLDIHMRRAQPYEIQKNSDYFDSQIGDRNDLGFVKRVYDTCEIANYKTPQTQKLQTVIVKTYLFDRNLTKLEA